MGNSESNLVYGVSTTVQITILLPIFYVWVLLLTQQISDNFFDSKIQLPLPLFEPLQFLQNSIENHLFSI